MLHHRKDFKKDSSHLLGEGTGGIRSCLIKDKVFEMGLEGSVESQKMGIGGSGEEGVFWASKGTGLRRGWWEATCDLRLERWLEPGQRRP